MRYRFCFFICILSFLLGSCDFFDDLEKNYKANVLWTREFFSYDNFPVPLIEGQYCYFTATRIPGGGSSISKIDLETGKVLWESERIWLERNNLADPQKIGAYIYLATNSGFVLVFDDSNGRLAATVMLREYETAAAQIAVRTRFYNDRASITASDPYLFWGNAPYSSASPKGLMRLDSREINFSKDPDEVQTIIPELVWSKEWRPQVSTNLFSDNGTIYFLTMSDVYYNPEFVSILTAMDAQTSAIIWERDMTQFKGILPSLILNGNKLHIIDKSNSCYDKNTGDLLYHNNDETMATSREIVLYNNFLYYLSNYYPYPPEEVELEIVSLNAETGKKEWQAYAMYDYVISPPFVNADKLFILNDTGLRVYNTKINSRSNFIGVDSSFKNYKCLNGFAYKDKLFLFVCEYGTLSPMFLIAIQCD